MSPPSDLTAAGATPPTAIRALVAEDDDDLGYLIEVLLEDEGYEVSRAPDGRSALTLARQLCPDVVLLDVMMPELNGLEVCQALRADPVTSNLPVIMLTAKGTPADAITGLRCGADDYITKPFDPEELLARLATTLHRSAQLRSASPLTGLPGNAAIVRQLDLLVSVPEQDFALLQADLDHFKAYNDFYGFLRGDETLRQTALILQEVLAPLTGPRFLGHIGGDDFALIVAAEQAEGTAEKVVDAFDLRAPDFYDPVDRERGRIEVPDRNGVMRSYPFVTISVGVASTAQGPFSSRHEVGEAAAEVKERAKHDPGSTWRLDRRHRGRPRD